MNTNTTQQINEALTFLLDETKSGYLQVKSFAAEQTPLLIQEILRWEIWANGLTGVAMIMFVFICAFALYKEYKTHNDLIDAEPIIIIPGSIFGSITLIIMWIPISACLKALIAPRLVLIDKLSEMIRQL